MDMYNAVWIKFWNRILCVCVILKWKHFDVLKLITLCMRVRVLCTTLSNGPNRHQSIERIFYLCAYIYLSSSDFIVFVTISNNVCIFTISFQSERNCCVYSFLAKTLFTYRFTFVQIVVYCNGYMVVLCLNCVFSHSNSSTSWIVYLYACLCECAFW